MKGGGWEVGMNEGEQLPQSGVEGGEEALGAW